MINDILDLSKIEAGQLEVDEQFFNLNELIDSTADFFAQKAHNKGLDLNVYVDPDLPPAVKNRSRLTPSDPRQSDKQRY